MKIYSKYFNAFTLAEMMVVLLIMSIVLACMAPVMTTKMKADQNIQTSPWKWVQQGGGRNLDAYFGNGDLQMAHIGQTQRGAADNAKLVINNSDFNNLLLFKNGDNVLGHLRINNDGLNLSTENNQAITIGHNVDGGFGSVAIGSNIMTHTDHHSAPSGHYNVALGVDALSSNTFGHRNEAIGWSALSSNTTGMENIGVGVSSLLSNTTGSKNTVLGTRAGSGNTTGSNNVIIGHEANNNAVSDKSNLVVIGSGASGSANNAIAIGAGVTGEGENSVAIGSNAVASKESGNIAIGSGAQSTGQLNNGTGSYPGSVAIGNSAVASGAQSVALGFNAVASDYRGIAIGAEAKASEGNWSSYSIAIGNYGTEASGFSSIALGTNAKSFVMDGIAIGSGARANGQNNVALGAGACANVKGSNKTCIGAYSGPATSSEWAKDNVERIFIGSQSRFNNGAAVLEVHNGTARFGISKNNITSPETAVVVNGVLVVKGGIYTAMPKLGANAHEATGGAEAFLLGSDDGSPNIRSTYSGQTGFGDYFNSYGKFKHPSGDFDVGLIRSDRRLKYVGKENNDGLAKLRQLKIFNYTFKKDEKKTPRVGVMAQDLQKIFPNAVTKGADGFLTIRMEDMFYAVINAIKELDAKYQAQEKRIENLEKRIQVLESKIK